MPLISVHDDNDEDVAHHCGGVAGRDPDQNIWRLGEFVAFNGLMWRYPDFLARAEAACEASEALPLTRRRNSRVIRNRGRHVASGTPRREVKLA